MHNVTFSFFLGEEQSDGGFIIRGPFGGDYHCHRSLPQTSLPQIIAGTIESTEDHRATTALRDKRMHLDNSLEFIGFDQKRLFCPEI